jgi:uncharacterized protein (UPF0332 family)
LRYRFEKCLEKGKIVRIKSDKDLVNKEIREAESDLEAAERSLREGDDKWAIIQGYYSFFHSLRSLIVGLGYREKSHRCLKDAVEALLVDEGRLERDVLESFSKAMDMREQADYGALYDHGSAVELVQAARGTFNEITNRKK